MILARILYWRRRIWLARQLVALADWIAARLRECVGTRGLIGPQRTRQTEPLGGNDVPIDS
jgi:hypothetical protein